MRVHRGRFLGIYGAMTTENVDVGRRETLQIVIRFNAERNLGAVPDGNSKFTLTFHPQ